ncbi:putative holin-like toxin [Enterococcus faecium]
MVSSSLIQFGSFVLALVGIMLTISKNNKK